MVHVAKEYRYLFVLLSQQFLEQHQACSATVTYYMKAKVVSDEVLSSRPQWLPLNIVSVITAPQTTPPCTSCFTATILLSCREMVGFHSRVRFSSRLRYFSYMHHFSTVRMTLLALITHLYESSDQLTLCQHTPRTLQSKYRDLYTNPSFMIDRSLQRGA